MIKVPTEVALAWRLRRHYLTGPGAASVEQVVERLIGVGVTPTGSGDPEVSVRLRLAGSEPDALRDAFRAGRLLAVYAFRGATQYLTPDQAAVHLAVRCAGRQWQIASWRSHYRLEPDDWPGLLALIEAAAQQPAGWDELAAAVAAEPRFAHLAKEFTNRNHTLMKPFMWQGAVSFGPSRNGQTTFQALSGNPSWPGLVELDQAGPRAVLAYLDAFGPATEDHLQYWLAAGLSAGKRRVNDWLKQVSAELVEVELNQGPALIRQRHLDGLRAATPDGSVHLLPGYDQWVVGAGTGEESIVPPHLRPAATKGSSVVLLDGRVVGTWSRNKSVVQVDRGAAMPPTQAVAAAVARLAERTGQGLSLKITS